MQNHCKTTFIHVSCSVDSDSTCHRSFGAPNKKIILFDSFMNDSWMAFAIMPQFIESNQTSRCLLYMVKNVCRGWHVPHVPSSNASDDKSHSIHL